MNNKRLSLKIHPSGWKRKTGKKIFDRKLRKLVTGWQTASGNGETSADLRPGLRNGPSRKVHFDIGNCTKKKAKLGLFKPLDDIAKKLLEINTSVSVQNEPCEETYSAHVADEKTIFHPVGETSPDETVKVIPSCLPSKDKELPDENMEHRSGSTNGVINDGFKDEMIIEEIICADGSLSQIIRNDCSMSNEMLGVLTERNRVCSSSSEETEDSMGEIQFVIGDNGKVLKLDQPISNPEFETDISKNDSLPSHSTFDRFYFESTFSSGSRMKRKFDDDKPIVVEMVEPAPKHHLISAQSMNHGNSAPMPFSYKDIAKRKVSLKKCSRYSNHKDVSVLLESSSVEATRPYLFRVLPSNKILLGLKYPHILYFRGRITLRVMFGAMEVLGYEIHSNGKEEAFEVCSPRGMSLLGLFASQSLCTTADYSRLADIGLDSHKIDEISSEMCDIDCLLLVENTPSLLVDFLNEHFPLNLFPSRGILRRKQRHFGVAEEVVHCKFVSPDNAENLKLMKQSDWRTPVEAISRNGKLRVVVCGGKSVGKSTFLRFLVNKNLAKHKEVLFLDFDPGQPEFTVPGCVSVVLIKKPLLGPNYFHLCHPCRMVYVGEINMSRCPVRYLQCVQHLIEFCHSQPQFSEIPWFINTMGFSKGLGVELTVNIIRMIGPSDVVQIQSVQNKRNFPDLLESTFVCDYQSTLFPISSALHSDLAYTFFELASAAEEPQSEDAAAHWGMQAHQLRELVVLSYLSQILTHPQQSLAEVVPFRLPFSKLKLYVCHEAVHYSHYLAAINCNLVALCSVGDGDTLVPSNPEYPQILLKLPICQCLGFGIVRGIDQETKVVYLICPLSEKELSQVNCLVLGPVTLPSGVLFKTTCITGQIPYISAGDGQPTGHHMRRSRSVSSLHKKKQRPKLTLIHNKLK